ncbi:Arc family DNA-binding protein [Rhizobium leguminosarum bv. viciae]|nr:Arc family DNA-binding protein [Rhizobium leguminosarum bv. viciae]
MREINPFPVRLPEEIRARIKASADENRRSLNSEIIVALERFYAHIDHNEKGSVSA